jgi:hypothetical protein
MRSMKGHRAGVGRRLGLGDWSGRVAVGDDVAGAAGATMSICVDDAAPWAGIRAKNLPRGAMRCHFVGDDPGGREGDVRTRPERPVSTGPSPAGAGSDSGPDRTHRRRPCFAMSHRRSARANHANHAKHGRSSGGRRSPVGPWGPGRSGCRRGRGRRAEPDPAMADEPAQGPTSKGDRSPMVGYSSVSRSSSSPHPPRPRARPDGRRRVHSPLPDRAPATLKGSSRTGTEARTSYSSFHRASLNSLARGEPRARDRVGPAAGWPRRPLPPSAPAGPR